MCAGKNISRLLLAVVLGLLGGCQNGPARPRAGLASTPGQPADGLVRAAPPLRITEPPPEVAENTRPASKESAGGDRLAQVGASAPPSESLPALPDVPAPSV